ncbi:MAG TPA: hypothetical protein VHD59_17170 [Pseudolabrys sp.]|nr:hypothetical protein [Pseudolabrys sp.]
MPGKIFTNLFRRKSPAPFRENDVFRGAPQWNDKNACVGNNGGQYDLYDYSEGYFSAAKGLLEIALSPPDPARAWRFHIDTLVYPICLTFRHAIELYLKYLITALAKDVGSRKIFKNSHSLSENWAIARSLIEGSRLDATDAELSTFDTLVKCIDEVDPKGETFRYPESIKKDQHLKDWSLINLRCLKLYLDVAENAASRWQRLIYNWA